jgi:hypothetical protein
MAVYDLDTNVWTGIRLNFSPNKLHYEFNVDSEGILNVLSDGLHPNEQGEEEHLLSLKRIALR